jgi:hypothetical protein
VARAPFVERPQPPRIEGATPTPAVPPPREAAAPREAVPQDMSAMIEARRRAREAAEPARMAVPEPAPSGAEDEAARRERAVAANLGTLKAPSTGENQRRGGGVFQLRRVGTEEAAFLFFGWNRDMGRNNTQQIEVRRGANASIELAVVRRMIAIIREYESGDFLWQSQRLGRSVTLSARASDNASLEAFMLREFF